MQDDPTEPPDPLVGRRSEYIAAYEQAARAVVAVQELAQILRSLDTPRLLGYAEVAESALVEVWRALQVPVALAMDRLRTSAPSAAEQEPD